MSVNKDADTSNGTNRIYIGRNMLTEQEIIDHVKKAINPKFKDWVLFGNGTYIILEDTAIKDKKEKALELMKEYEPVSVGSPAGDISITKLTYTEGWVIGGHYYGMYTYVHPKELENKGVNNPTDLDVGLGGRYKRNKDGKELKVIFVHK
ncbi:MAG TPA: hypothetical protein VKT28_12170 [Puia sp.]|nr:hypothetical protein [Puia sp.]